MAMVGWGAAYVPSALLVESWPPLLAAGARLALAGALLLGALAALGHPVRPGAGLGAVAWLALTQTVCFYGATFYGIAHGGAGLAAVLANTDPLFVAALAVLFLDEHLSARQWGGLVVGLAGAATVVWRGGWPPTLSVTALVVVAGALAWGLGTVAAARVVRGPARPLALGGWQMALGGATLLVWGLVAEGGPEAAGAREAGLVVGLAALGSALPLACFYLALVRAPAGRVSAWFFLVPVVGVLSAWALLGQRPGPRLLVGLALVAIGLWLVLGRAGRSRGRLVDSAPPP